MTVSSNLVRAQILAVLAVALSVVAVGCTTNVYVASPPAADGSEGGGKDATYAMQTAVLFAESVPATDYTLGFETFLMEKDAHNVVQSVGDHAQLTAHSVTGQDYAVHHGALTGLSTLAEVNAAYDGATARGLLSSLTTLQLPATMFDLVGPDLDTTPQRTVILRNTAHGVSSYQLILVTFIP